MKDYKELAIDKLMGQVKIGNVVAHRNHRLAHDLIDIIGNIGICKLPDGTINKFPINELFNPNRVARLAVQIMAEDTFHNRN